MKNNPRVSVLIPTYNDAEYLPDAINSILVQTFDDFELIIVDDGSTDNTRELLSTYNDQRLKILSLEKNCGRPTARNIALDAAIGEYLCWMDSDDISLPKRLEKQVQFMDAHPEISVCSGKILYFHEADGIWAPPLLHKDIETGLFFAPTIANAAACMRASAIKKYNLRFDPELYRAQDYDFWCQFILDKRGAAANLDEILYLYRYRKKSSKHCHKIVQKKNLDRLHIKYTDETLQKYIELSFLNSEEFSFTFKEYAQFAETILASNGTYKIFNQIQLSRLLADQLYRMSRKFHNSRYEAIVLCLQNMQFSALVYLFFSLTTRKLLHSLNKLEKTLAQKIT